MFYLGSDTLIGQNLTTVTEIEDQRQLTKTGCLENISRGRKRIQTD
jgi:hypothetical protein